MGYLYSLYCSHYTTNLHAFTIHKGATKAILVYALVRTITFGRIELGMELLCTYISLYLCQI